MAADRKRTLQDHKRIRKTLLAIADINEMTSEEFIDVFGNVVEQSSFFAAAVWHHRPFQDVHHIHQVVCEFLTNLPCHGKQGLLRSFQDLSDSVGLSSESKGERRAAGIDSLSHDETEKIQERNEMYRDKFNFPFVICARKNKKEAILEGLEIRLRNSFDEELTNGVEEVKQIALFRLLDIVEN
ncbi:2-oxo-4-hydroxy-4-carboxy-5-ureidoimidazoline decarboxylase-like [Ylistrum balloti]|uniref:2-oxo-4-hydroxy-4-carboxy-5-ureidoimidazoline decarboxylase-like n=1 Tax=Ylistrum balloti TaxID=509963 RepID=UPI002905C40B|nr:2-oxo-4-hydroxy-4-carboxy-5-ureidoimidazoline decarboxylase-like [Ylistrum balloti]